MQISHQTSKENSMRNGNSMAHRSNMFLFLGVTLGLLLAVLLLIPYLARPTMARTVVAFRVAVQVTATPSATPVAPTPTAPSAILTVTPRPHVAANCRRYTVQPGETLLSLADRLGVSAANLALTNNLYSDALTAGRVLVICTPFPQWVPLGPEEIRPGEVVSLPPSLAQVEVLMTLTYPRKIYTRRPQWITLTVRPLEGEVSGEGLLPEVEEATRQAPVVIGPAPPPPLDVSTMIVGGERWLETRLTGRSVTPRSGTVQIAQAMTQMMDQGGMLQWQWLFTPTEAGNYLFGLDVFVSDEYQMRRPSGEIVRERTMPRLVWSQNFNVSVDEIFGIPRLWWVLISGLGALMNLVLAVIQIMAQ